MTPEQYDAMLVAQGGGCAICGTKEPGRKKGVFAVDHDHITGKVRALLCTNCNIGIGNLGDDPVRLRTAADYLESFQQAEVVCG